MTRRLAAGAETVPVVMVGSAVAARRASTATTSASTEPTLIAARIPAMTAAAWRCRCRRRTSSNSRVPAASPFTRRDASQNASCSGVNAPDALA